MMLSFFPSRRAAWMCSVAMAGVLAGGVAAAGAQAAQTPTDSQTSSQSSDNGQTTTQQGTATDGSGAPAQTTSTVKVFGRRQPKDKSDKVVQSKDTKKNLKREHKVDVLVGQDSKLPDKALYDKAVIAMKKGHFDVARLDLQTMLNTYPDSQYQMRAKLAIADSWYKEGGTAALTQAESEYADFRVFFPNVPEAAEAQMRIGDIYFRQMDKPDRDYTKALNAETEYRRMLTDYPDSVLVPQAKQRLREVQEVLASREADIASFYATRENWAAVIARYQTVVDTYPLYSHMDDTLIGLGDAYEAQARYIRGMKLPEGGKAKLEKLYDGMAADAYRKVVLEHAAAAHVEDAKERLEAMSLPVPTPTAEQVAASQALENSRSTYKLANRMELLILRKPDTVLTAGMGDPTLVDPKPVVAPTIVRKATDNFKEAFDPNSAKERRTDVQAAEQASTGIKPTTPEGAPAAPAAPLTLQDVPAAGAGGGSVDTTSAVTSTGGDTPTSTGTGASTSMEIVPSGNVAAPPATGPASGAQDSNYGLKAVGPAPDLNALPATEKAAAAPDQPNQITAATPAAQQPNAKGKAPKSDYDKGEESSSTHKKKKGLKKILPPNPF